MNQSTVSWAIFTFKFFSNAFFLCVFLDHNSSLWIGMFLLVEHVSFNFEAMVYLIVHIQIFCKKKVTLAEVFSGGNPRRILFSPGNGFADKMEHIVSNLIYCTSTVVTISWIRIIFFSNLKMMHILKHFIKLSTLKHGNMSSTFYIKL